MISVDIQPFERQLILMMDVVRENVGYTRADDLDRFYGRI